MSIGRPIRETAATATGLVRHTGQAIGKDEMGEAFDGKSDLAPQEVTLLTNAQKGATAWRRLGMNLRAITPTDIIRYLFVAGVLLTLIWLVTLAWPALVPFVVGAGLAYAVLPLVNSLDRFMSRRLAAVLAMLTAVGLLVLAIAAIIPVLIDQFLRFVAVLPTVDQLLEYNDRLQPLLTQLPGPLQQPVSESLNEAGRVLT